VTGPTVTVRYFAGARAAAGVDAETRTAGTLDELIGQIVDAHGERLERVLTACSFLVDGTQTRDRSSVLDPGVVVDVLPPFAGG
jgi:sulfur-carrier protein